METPLLLQLRNSLACIDSLVTRSRNVRPSPSRIELGHRLGFDSLYHFVEPENAKKYIL